MTRTERMQRRVLYAAVALGVATLGVPGSAGAVGDAAAAEPHAVQVLSARTSPRAGRAFLGVAVATLEEGARLYRSVTPTCTRGRIRVGPNRTLGVPVAIARLPRSPDEGGRVRAVTTCMWRLPRGVRGRTLSASVVVRYVNLDGTSGGESGQTVEWEVR
jgi:hypothetical protein